MVLEELRLEVLRHRPSSNNRENLSGDAANDLTSGFGASILSTGNAVGPNTQYDPFVTTFSADDPALNHVESLEPLGKSLTAISPSSSVVEMTTWEQFDSLVC